MTVNKRLNAEELEAIRKRAEAATPGPWFDSETVYVVSNVRGDSIEWGADFIAETQEQSDAEFIANAREDVPKLLVEIERLRKTLDYINDLAGEFFTVEDEEGVFSITNEQPHKDTMQEIFVISYEAVNADD
jgi:hypothetical protein